MNKPKLVATARPGVHQVKIYKNRYVRTFVYARVRKATFSPPTFRQFMPYVFKIAHDMLQESTVVKNEPENEEL